MRIRFALCVISALPVLALAQAYPAKPVRMVLGLGGGAEIAARLVAQHAGAALGQPILVEPQSAAGGSIAANTVEIRARWLHSALRRGAVAGLSPPADEDDALRSVQRLHADRSHRRCGAVRRVHP